MLELWLKLKILFDYIIPLCIFGIIILLFLIYIIYIYIKSIFWNKKIKLLKKEGYQRYLIRVASVGDGSWYGWQYDNYKHKITEEDLDEISYQNLKKEIEYVKRHR